MKKLFKIISGIISLATTTSLFAASFTVDDLNLREAIPNINPPAAYFKIGLEEAWNKINNTQNLLLSPITVGILDTGVDVTHEEFRGVNFGNTPAGTRKDRGDIVNGVSESHGTNVVGIIGANNISATSSSNYVPPHMNGVLSGAKNLDYVLENRVAPKNPFDIALTARSIFTISKQINEISENGGSIINISQEEGFSGRVSEFVFSIFKDSFTKHPDTLFVVAAGNGGRPVSGGLLGFDISPANLGNLPNVITVGATTIDDMRYTTIVDGKSVGSNFGPEVSISAPGDSVFSPSFYSPPLDISDYDFFNGTSAAAPLVTGTAGLLKAIKPSLTPAQIKQILIRSADPITTDQPIGGRLNARKAVCDPLVLNCATTPEIAFFEGWESVPIGHPLCEASLETGFASCAFTADSGQWLVREIRNRDTQTGGSISSVEVLPGKILKLVPAVGDDTGIINRRSIATSPISTVLSQTTVMSFTDHSVSTDNASTSVRSGLRIFFQRKSGESFSCPSNGSVAGSASLSYIFENTSGIISPSFPCEITFNIGPTTSFSRNLYNDFAPLFPASPEGWDIIIIVMDVINPFVFTHPSVSATWDNIMITR